MSNYAAWKIKENDFPANGDIEDQITFFCRLGILAPSLHNIQPWHFKIRGSQLIVTLDRSRMLESGDPLERETWISIGACVENILVAGRYFGFGAEISRLENSEDGVVLKFKKTSSNPEEVFRAIVDRVTDRGEYEGRILSMEEVKALEDTKHPQGIQIKIVTSSSVINEIASLTAKAIGLAMSSSEFKKELTAMMKNNATRSFSGMPGFTMGLGLTRSFLQPLIIRFAGSASRQAAHEYRTIKSSSAIALVFSNGDTKKYWFDAGRAYQAIGIKATTLGLHQATTAAIVEALDFHSDVEKLMRVNSRLQTILRLGSSKDSPRHSPRYPVEESID